MMDTPEPPEELTAEIAEGLRCGFADMDAGRIMPLQAAQEGFQAVFATQYPLAVDEEATEG